MKPPLFIFTRLIFKRAAFAALVGLSILLSGCDPQDIVRWSPDGSQAIVSAGDKTYLVDAGGKILGEAPDARVWMPDSRRVIAVRKVKAANWAEVAALLGDERAQEVARAGEELAGFVHGYHGDWSKFLEIDALKHWENSHQNLWASYADWDGGANASLLALYYLQEKDPASAAPLLAGIAKDDALGGNPGIMISELVVKSALPENPVSELVLLRTLDPIAFIRPSPNGKEIAIVINEPMRPGLYLLPADGGDRVSVDSGAAEADWTPDGQWLTYAKTTLSYAALENQMLLGTITRCRVCDDKGRLLPKVENPEDLAGVLHAKGVNRVACLPDGRILFAGIEIALPMTTKDVSRRLTLFALTPGDAPKIARIVGEEASKHLPLRVDLFSLSPDRRHVAVPGDHGEVAIVAIETGEVQEIQDEIENMSENNRLLNKQSIVPVIPSWRNATEFSYVSAAGKPGAGPKRAEFVLRTLRGAPQAISVAWTDEMTDTFLPRPKEMTKPE